MAVRSLAQSSLVEPFTTNSMLAGYSGNAFHHLETVRLSSNAATVEFTNLARYSDFQHLQLRYAVRSTRAQVNSGLFMRFNGDTANNYVVHQLIGTGSSVSSTASTARSTTLALPIPAANATASAFGAGVVDLLDPFETTKNTTIRGLGGIASSFNELQLASGLWLNTAALTSITLVAILSDQWVSGSRLSLYGLKSRS
jgi:hypothetical protein